MPVSTKMDSEDHYHSPYDTNELDSDVSFSPRNFMKYHICVFLFAYVFVFVHKKNNFILKMQAHYEAPSCLKRNPSGSLFIPSGKQQQLHHYLKNHFLSSQKSLLRSQRSNIAIYKGTDPSPGEKTLPLESRLRYNAYSPHHTIRQVNISTKMMMMMMMKNVVLL